MGSQRGAVDVLAPERVMTAPPGPAGTNGLAARVAARAMRIVWVWPALLMLTVGCYRVTGPELWRDELSSWSFASRPIPELTATVQHSDASQLAYYLLLHYWIAAFGDSVLVMRLLSVLAMTGAAVCVTLIGRRLADGRAGLLGGLVFALVPSVSRFSQETRFYALEVLVAMLATLALLCALERPGIGRWALYACSVAVLGYVDLVALCLLAGHAVAVALQLWQNWRRSRADQLSGTRASRTRTFGILAFLPAAAVGCAACLPLALVGLGQANDQVGWIPRPGLSFSAFDFFGRNLFYSTSAAAALIIVAVFAWAVAWRAAAIASAIAIVPVAVLWGASQGAVSYFFPRYLLFTVGAWAILAGVALSKLDVRVAAAAVLVFGILGAGDQRVIREQGAHNWAEYPVSDGTTYWDYLDAAAIVARQARSGDGIIYPGQWHSWMMINFGVQYYLARSLPVARMPREVFVSVTAAAAEALYPHLCLHPARCLGQTPRVWIVTNGHSRNLYNEIPKNEAALLRAHYHPTEPRHLPDLTIALLQHT